MGAVANDYSGYVPTLELILPEVYDPRLSKTSVLELLAGDKIVETFDEIFKI